jgi:hypothetical protein
MAEGKGFGRSPMLKKHYAPEALKRVAAGQPLREIALSYAVDHSTISRLKARHIRLSRACVSRNNVSRSRKLAALHR